MRTLNSKHRVNVSWEQDNSIREVSVSCGEEFGYMGLKRFNKPAVLRMEQLDVGIKEPNQHLVIDQQLIFELHPKVFASSIARVVPLRPIVRKNLCIALKDGSYQAFKLSK